MKENYEIRLLEGLNDLDFGSTEEEVKLSLGEPEEMETIIEEDGIAYRGLFLIDRQGIVRHQLVNDLPLGRSVDEALRLLDALIFHEEHGEVCPANWKTGAKAMKPDEEGLAEYFR